MSYDVWLEADLGGPEPVQLGADWNYTSNCVAIWRMAMPSTNGLAWFEGRTAGECAEVLRHGLASMWADPTAFWPLEPRNGWGSLASTRDALAELLTQFERAPAATVRIYR